MRFWFNPLSFKPIFLLIIIYISPSSLLLSFRSSYFCTIARRVSSSRYRDISTLVSIVSVIAIALPWLYSSFYYPDLPGSYLALPPFRVTTSAFLIAGPVPVAAASTYLLPLGPQRSRTKSSTYKIATPRLYSNFAIARRASIPKVSTLAHQQQHHVVSRYSSTHLFPSPSVLHVATVQLATSLVLTRFYRDQPLWLHQLPMLPLPLPPPILRRAMSQQRRNRRSQRSTGKLPLIFAMRILFFFLRCRVPMDIMPRAHTSFSRHC